MTTTRSEAAVFFYGLFMDEAVLAAKGVVPSDARAVYVEGYRLSIGQRATRVPEEGRRAYGLVMTIGADEAADLYSDATVADYVPEPVSMTLPDGSVRPAVCYNLPPGQLDGTDAADAEALLELAIGLGFPRENLDRIRKR